MTGKRTLVLFLVALLIVIELIGFARPGELAAVLLKADPRLVLLALASYTIAIAVFAFIWQLLLRAVGIGLPFQENLRLVYSSVFFNVATPTASYGGEAVRAYLLAKRYGADPGLGISTIVAHRIAGTLAGSLASLAVGLYLVLAYPLPTYLLVLIVLASVLALIGFLLLLYLGLDLERSKRLLARALPIIWRLGYKGGESGIVEVLASYNRGLRTLSSKRTVLLSSLILGLAAWALVNMVAVFSFRAVALGAPAQDLLIFTLYAVIRLVPTGLPEFVGSKEFLLTTLVALLGISAAGFKIAGGIVLLLMALEIIFGFNIVHPSEHNVAWVIIATPILTGPGVITTAIIFASRYGPMVTLAAGVSALFVTWALLRNALLIVRTVGSNVIEISSKVIGLLIVAMAIEFILRGGLEFLRSYPVQPL